jgi:hypothetical protein
MHIGDITRRFGGFSDWLAKRGLDDISRQAWEVLLLMTLHAADLVHDEQIREALVAALGTLPQEHKDAVIAALRLITPPDHQAGLVVPDSGH